MKDSKIVVALRAVVVAARTYACAGTELTKVSMEALQVGADPEDIIVAVQGGFEEVGENMPKAWASNFRRLAKAGGDYVQKVLDSGRALNNNLLADLEVPKATNAGAKTKADKPKAEAANDAINLGTLDGALVALQGVMAARTKFVPTGEPFNKFEDSLSECIAILRSAKPKADKPKADKPKAETK